MLRTCIISGCQHHCNSINTRKAWHSNSLERLSGLSPRDIFSHYSACKPTATQRGCELCPAHQKQLGALIAYGQERVQAFLDGVPGQANMDGPPGLPPPLLDMHETDGLPSPPLLHTLEAHGLPSPAPPLNDMATCMATAAVRPRPPRLVSRFRF